MTFVLGFIGDTHGDLEATLRACDELYDLGCRDVIQVGDHGFIWPSDMKGYVHLSRYLVSKGMKMRYLDGNHDYFPLLFRLPRNTENNVAENLTYQHRGTVYKYDDGPAVMFLGGAASIDYRGRKEHFTWWREELITDDDVAAALSHKDSKIDILCTHDSPVPPPGIKETSDMTFNYRAAECQARIREVVDVINPPLLIHGHYHLRYSDKYHDTKVEGLDCNYGKFPNFTYVYEQK